MNVGGHEKILEPLSALSRDTNWEARKQYSMEIFNKSKL